MTNLLYSNNGYVYSERATKCSDDELEIAKFLADIGHTVILIQEVRNQKTADALVDGVLVEFKTISNTTNFGNRVQQDISRGKEQADNILLYIKQKQKFDYKSFYKGIEYAIKFDSYQKISTIQILFESRKLIILNRSQIEDGSYKEILK